MNTPGSDQVREQLLRARELQADGSLDEAEAIIRDILKLDSCNVDALSLMGYVYQSRDDANTAETMMMRAVAFQPEHPPNYASLGELYSRLGQYELAISCYRNGLKIDDSFMPCLQGLFTALQHVDQKLQAKIVGQRLLELGPTDFGALHNVGALNLSLGDFDEAIELLSKALQVKEDVSTREMLGRAYSLKGDAANAYRQYQLILKHNPDHAIAAHHLAANSTDPDDIPARAADEYVRQAFNEFAENFDKTLGDLRYQAPKIIDHLMAQRLANPESQYSVVDLGCGTGLCGVEIEPYCRELVGVDLSDEMLKIAEQTAAYSELVRSELVSFLSQSNTRFDVAVSSDSLIYLGDLDPVFRATANQLVAGGWLIATFETIEKDAPEPYKLTRSGRYAHSRQYLLESLRSAGFEEIEVMEVHLRVEVGKPVEGYAVAARVPLS